jgi:hypothetical protein
MTFSGGGLPILQPVAQSAQRPPQRADETVRMSFKFKSFIAGETAGRHLDPAARLLGCALNALFAEHLAS